MSSPTQEGTGAVRPVRAGKDRPIILPGPSVLAAQQGRKTQHRIVLPNVPASPGMGVLRPEEAPRHAAPYLDAYCSQPRTPANPRGMSDLWCWWTRDDRACPQFKVGYRPGDHLWVRETWAFVDGEDLDAIAFRADCEGQSDTWRSPIYLPRVASRLTLAIESVRVQRLQDISRMDAMAEGIAPLGFRAGFEMPGDEGGARYDTARDAYAALWNSIHGTGAWQANPWVAALTFRAIPRNIDSFRITPTPDEPTGASSSLITEQSR